MTIKLTPAMEKIVDDKIKAGDFATAEDVVFAGLQALQVHTESMNSEAGEMERLIEAGKASVENEGTLDLDEAFAERRARREQGPPDEVPNLGARQIAIISMPSGSS